MKIGYVFSYLGDGGSEEYAFCLAKKAIESGDEAVFICSSVSTEARKKLKSNNLKCINLGMESSFNIFGVISAAIKLKKIIRAEKIDIIHANMLREHSIAILTKIIGGKFVIVRTFHRFNQFNWKMKPLMPVYRKFTDGFVSISDEMSRYLHKNGIDKKIYLIKNGVNRVDASKHQDALGFMGRLTSEKGIKSFVLANMDLLKKTKLYIAGDGPAMDDIKTIVDENKLKVELLGRVTDKTSFFEKISVMILPSETEVMPLVILEAYSCGIPVVSFDIAPLIEVVPKENGVMVEFGDYEKMGQVAAELLEKSKDYYDVNIKTYKEKYSIEKMWKSTRDVYSLLINGR